MEGRDDAKVSCASCSVCSRSSFPRGSPLTGEVVMLTTSTQLRLDGASHCCCCAVRLLLASYITCVLLYIRLE